MTLLNNSFIRALILLGVVMGMFWMAKWCGAQNIGAEIVTVAITIAGVAAGALKSEEKVNPPAANTTVKETTVSSSVTDKPGVSLPQETEH